MAANKIDWADVGHRVYWTVIEGSLASVIPALSFYQGFDAEALGWVALIGAIAGLLALVKNVAQQRLRKRDQQLPLPLP
jgi:hypothetical protein